jgi:molybdopterin converting factor small subunit
MKIRIKYFGMLVEATGVDQELLELPDAEQYPLAELLIQRHPQLGTMPWKLAIDHAFVEGDLHALRSDSEVVLLPPFAGG